jgi:hypothetical protein
VIRHRRVFTLIVVFACGAASSITGFATAQDRSRPSLPTPEMQRLARLYVGTWTYTERYPNGSVNTGTYTSEPGPGGNSIFNRFRSRGPAGDFDGAIIMTWDAREKAYKEYVFGNGFSGALFATGRWEGDSLVYRTEIAAGANKLVIRNRTTFSGDTTLTSDQYSSANGGPESPIVHVEAVRKKP